MNQNSFKKLISGQNAGLGATPLRFFLGVVAQIYLLVIWLRNFLYSKGLLKTHSVEVKVISIGNITVGGTGKTPLVIWLCKFLQQKEIHCAILTRGYKTQAQIRATSDERRATRIDEPAILAESCPEAKVIVNPDRVAGANEAVNKFGAKILIMDDGFQHQRLARDLDIVTIDATCPFGYGKLLPAGLLREPVDSLKRADAVVITRCNHVSETELGQIENKIQNVKPGMIIARSIHNPACVKYPEPAEARIQQKNETMDSCFRRNDSIEQIKGKKIFALCGIGNPGAFFNTIEKLGADLVGSRIYDDHYHYTEKDISAICEKAKKLKADLILTTQKDWTKLPVEKIKSKIEIPFAYLAIELKFISGEDKIMQLIEQTLAGKIHKKY